MTKEFSKKRIMLCTVVFALLFSSFTIFANVQKASAVQINKPWLIKTKIVQQAKKGNNFTAIINYRNRKTKTHCFSCGIQSFY